MSEPIRVLFVCTGNTARSQMAEAILRHMEPTRFEAVSAGTDPGEVDPRTLEVLERHGIDTTGLRSKALDEVIDGPFDYVISLCDKASTECQTLSRSGMAQDLIAWNFDDPAASDDPLAFRRTLHEIQERVKMFVLVSSRKHGEPS